MLVYDPAPHVAQALEPGADHWFCGQVVQLGDAARAYVLIGHWTQALAPEPENEPAGQAVHALAPAPASREGFECEVRQRKTPFNVRMCMHVSKNSIFL